ncbi:MAG: glycosyltransferase family 4 protein [Candidatus Syntropharchaeales archaeon]
MNALALIADLSPSFERNDVEILKRDFDVDHIEKPSGMGDWPRYLRQLGRIKKARGVFVWFAGWPAYFALLRARRYRKPIAVVVGGYDAARLPEIGYGATLKLKERRATLRVLRDADLLLPVSEATSRELMSICNPRRTEMIYNGVDTKRFRPAGDKEDIVLSVGGVNRSNYVKKGIDHFMEAARALPEYQFRMVGGCSHDLIEDLRRRSPPNLVFTGYLDDAELLQEYQRASVYLQPSAHESFGVSVVEAMLCGCIAAVSDRYALPEVVGDAGKVFPYGNTEKMIEAIKSGLKADSVDRKRTRQRGELFSLERRERWLTEALSEMIG